MEDIEQLKCELEEGEYIQMREETIEQLKEFEHHLQKSNDGSLSLVDSVNGVQLAIQAAIRSNASPESAKLFIRKENTALRSRLAWLESDRRLNKIAEEAFISQTLEILLMLEKLKEPLSLGEQEMLRRYTKNICMDGFTTTGSFDIDSKVAISNATKDLHLNHK